MGSEDKSDNSTPGADLTPLTKEQVDWWMGTVQMEFHFDAIVHAVRLEREAQIRQWGSQSGLRNFHMLAVLGEEYGEVAKELLENNDDVSEALEKELVQVAAVSFKWIERIREIRKLRKMLEDAATPTKDSSEPAG